LLRLTKPCIGKEESEAAAKVLESGWLAEGKITQQFEAELAKFVGVNHAVVVSNCTVAITLALQAHEVKGYVAIPDFTHPATATAVLNAGCHPYLCDTSLESYNIIDAGTCQTTVPVSWAGNPLKNYPLSCIIEDAACSLGAGKTGKDFTTCFSFHPRKLLTCGEGGAVVSDNSYIIDKIRKLKNFGEKGGNYKLDDLRAAILIEQLKKLPTIIKRRREMAKVYSELLQEVKGATLPQASEGHTYQTYAVLLGKHVDRDAIIQKLAAKSIETQIGTYALHLLPQFKSLRRFNELRNSELLYHNLLALPMAYDLTLEDQQHIVSELKNELS
jgi:dTDP-4-amino-4,6-dideoxygalactose transaminase